MISKSVDESLIGEQARRLRGEMPELYEYLVGRENAYESALFAAASSIPDPKDIPDISTPFLNLIHIKLEPKTEEKCKHWLTPPEGLPDLIGPERRERLYRICLKGVYLRAGRLDSLAQRS